MNFDRSRRAGFTLIELMVVVGILGIVLMMGIPSIYHMVHRESMSTTVNEVRDACIAARRSAILGGTMTVMHIRPLAGVIDVDGTAFAPKPVPMQAVTGRYAKVDLDTITGGPVHKSGQPTSVHIPSSIRIEMVDINFVEYKDAPEARVRFYPNGTSDELTLVLHGDNNEWRKISLELVTALPDVERLNQ